VSRRNSQRKKALSPRSRSKSARSARRTRVGAANRAGRQGESVGKLFESLVALQARLRAPGGCPWDREQTHDSLRTYLIEETYEVLDALESRNKEKVADELGDLLLQIVFHAELGREAGRFDIREVIRRIHTKMVRRHPHVFGDFKARTSGEVLKKWEELKAEERAAQGDAERANRPASVLDGVSVGLPAIIEAHQISRRAANVGFDWISVEEILQKVEEEISELRETLQTGDGKRREEEIGDLLFTVVNIARFLGLDPEMALKLANRKFKRRFQVMEQDAAGSGRTLAGRNAAELDELWNAAKRVRQTTK